jgi:N-acetylglucosamine-6-phosphate deacetylase
MRLGVEAALVGRTLVPGDVETVDGRIAAYGLASPNGSGIATPGFVDLQVNGFAGIDFLEADAEGYKHASDALLETGVTAFLATFITAPEEQLLAALQNVPRRFDGARVLGVHLEGPFVAPERLGIHPAGQRRDPDTELLERLVSAGPVRLVTLAPERPGAFDLIDLLRGRGITVSCGHSDASSDEATEAFNRGVRAVTHLFNAMRPFLHRDPGIAGAALARDDVVIQLILDGAHLAPETAQVVWRAAKGRVALVTDSFAGAGAVDGTYSLGGLEIEVRDGVARGSNGSLAGTTIRMLDAVRNLHALGVPLADALDAATAVPARVIGAPSVGRLDVDQAADVVVLNDNLDIERVFVRGDARVVC